MKLALRSKPKTLIGRAEAAGNEALEFARGVPERLDTSRKRALAVAGGATSAAVGFAFWRSRRDDDASVHSDPAKPPTPWKATPPPPASGAPASTPAEAASAKKPVTSSKAAATNAAGSRSK